MELETENNCF